jgi:hypothetical protein
MKLRTSLGWIGALAVATTALASALLTAKVSGDAVLELKTGETAYASMYMEQSGEKFYGELSYEKEASNVSAAFKFKALAFESFKVAPDFAFADGVGLMSLGKGPSWKTHFSLTVTESGKSSSQDEFVLTLYDGAGNARHLYGWVVKGDFSIVVDE